MAGIDCSEARELLGACADDELPAAERTAVARHLDGCADCRKALADLQMLQSRVRAVGRFAMPHDLQARIGSAIDGIAEDRPVSSWLRYRALAASHIAIGLLFAAAAAWLVDRHAAREAVSRELVSAHVRSLLTGPLVQVASTDTHVLKPWLVTKVPFAPDLADLADRGFPLHGARAEHVLGQPAAAVVYARRNHRINVLIVPAAGAPLAAAIERNVSGFNVIGWREHDLAYFAVSDLNLAELRELTAALREQSTAR